MTALTLDQLKQIVKANGKLDGWDFSTVRAECAPPLWNYVDVVCQYLKRTDRVLDIGTGGGEIFLSLSSYFGNGVGIDHNPAMIDRARINQSAELIDNITLTTMEGGALQFDAETFDVVLLRQAKAYVSEIVRVLRPGGYFITQQIGMRNSLNILNAFDWTPASFGEDWWQPAAELAEQFRAHDCHIVAEAEYDVPYWFHDIESFLFWLMAVPWPERIDLEKHWQNVNQIVDSFSTERGIETNEHRGLLIIQKL